MNRKGNGATLKAAYQDRLVAEIRGVFQQAFSPAQVEVKRYNSASIRARVIDEKFKAMSISEREKAVQPLLARLSPEAMADLTMLLLIPRSELADWPNVEFENPGHSRL